ncbi:uncharacterized protein LOC141915250 [Tubulanus polymorphus]|uniref:uncharacterized protein LOC141915250 n=1 Tax=Tubulanus polymorphus TaxID=672921 RepID=UPI003DA68010
MSTTTTTAARGQGHPAVCPAARYSPVMPPSYQPVPYMIPAPAAWSMPPTAWSTPPRHWSTPLNWSTPISYHHLPQMAPRVLPMSPFMFSPLIPARSPATPPVKPNTTPSTVNSANSSGYSTMNETPPETSDVTMATTTPKVKAKKPMTTRRIVRCRRVYQNNEVKPRNAGLPQKAVTTMLDWFESHRENPYPTTEQLQQISVDCEITVAQVKSWFANKRNRSFTTRAKTEKRKLEEHLLTLCEELMQPNKRLNLTAPYVVSRIVKLIKHSNKNSAI